MSFPSLYEMGNTLRGEFIKASDAFDEKYTNEKVPQDKIKNITVLLSHGAFMDHREMFKHVQYYVRGFFLKKKMIFSFFFQRLIIKKNRWL